MLSESYGTQGRHVATIASSRNVSNCTVLENDSIHPAASNSSFAPERTYIRSRLCCYVSVPLSCSLLVFANYLIVCSLSAMFFKSVLSALAVLPAVLAQVGNIVQITEDFGPNPNDVQFWIYVPANTPANAPILVNPHWCTGTAAAVFRGTQLAANADIYKYIMIFPETPRASKWYVLPIANVERAFT